ncbi:TolC family protein [Planctomicrobium sp. SH661]|uniref:TolC family protein n=1 Tax=Planctomicrobium sp. SH661 TaxID=3448124 RepID=UPI003F5C55D6
MVRFARSSKSRAAHAAVATALLGSSLFALPGCHIPDLRPARAARDIPDTFNGEFPAENSAHVGIDDFFKDPILTSLIYESLDGNQELRILGEEIQIANNEILARRGAIFPFVTFGGTAGMDKPSLFTPQGAVEDQLDYSPGRGFPEPLPNFMFGANVSWEVDIWRQLRNSRDAAALRYLGTIDGRNYVVTSLIAEIADNYYTLLALDQRLENLDRTIALQERSLEIAEASKEGARGTELAVQRFRAEVKKNQSQKLIIKQQIIEVENRINFLCGRYPQPVSRFTPDFFELSLHTLSLGVPCQLLMNRPDIRQAERELQAAGLDVRIAKANFYPKLNIRAGVGYEAFNPKYLVVTPESLIYGVASDLVAPVVNRSAVKAEYMSANAAQLQAVYKYQQVILNAFTEVMNNINKVENYTQSIAFKREQLSSLEASVDAAGKLFNATRIEYLDVLYAQRDLMDGRMELIEAKKEQLSAIVNTYQALGGGLVAAEYREWPVYTPDTVVPTPAVPKDGIPPFLPPPPATVPPEAPKALEIPKAPE